MPVAYRRRLEALQHLLRTLCRGPSRPLVHKVAASSSSVPRNASRHHALPCGVLRRLHGASLSDQPTGRHRGEVTAVRPFPEGRVPGLVGVQPPSDRVPATRGKRRSSSLHVVGALGRIRTRAITGGRNPKLYPLSYEGVKKPYGLTQRPIRKGENEDWLPRRDGKH